MEDVTEPVTLLFILTLWLLGSVVGIKAFRLGLMNSCGGHYCNCVC